MNTQQNNIATFAAGCFWGVEYHFSKEKGVIQTTVGYSGGHKENPSYEDVCSGTTGHKEVIQVVFDPTQTSYDKLVRLFFEIHDFSQENGQGPDIGEQYLSFIFYHTPEQKQVAEAIIQELKAKGYHVATRLEAAQTFWKAEDYHQNYYAKKGTLPYCHVRKKIF